LQRPNALAYFALPTVTKPKKSFYNLEALMCKIDAGILNWYGIKFPQKKNYKSKHPISIQTRE
jgi:hypothetical protein